jgi:hypothetical protein
MSRTISFLRGVLCTVSLATVLLGASSVDAQVTPPPAPIPPTLEVDTGYVNYDEGPISLPLGIGLRLPGYNRVDGLVLPWGPKISLAAGRVRIDPTVTYRSHIGKIDPFVKMHLVPGPALELEVAGGRSTFTNDEWIRSDLINSGAAFFVGSDARNYFRADRGWITLSHTTSRAGLVITPSVGALTEHDWSTGSALRHTNAPWSLFYKTDSLKMRRPNPAIADGHVSSGLGRLKVEYEREDVTAKVDAGLEHAFDGPPTQFGTNRNSSGEFTQITIGSKVSFPTFGTQRFDFRGHAVITPGDIAPPQRFAYLGGAGTLATVDLLALGGDRLFYAEGEYSIPIDRIQLGVIGSPIVSARYAAGAAGVGELPDFIQNIGVGLGVRFLKAEYHIDPNFKKTAFTRKHAVAIGISLSL